MLTRRELVEYGAIFAGAALMGALGGVTSTDEGRKPERRDGEEPPP